MPGKRKEFSPPASRPAAKKQECCIIHTPGIKHGPFTVFSSELNERLKVLNVLHNVRNRRMAEPASSKYRMPNICLGIPDEVNDKEGYPGVVTNGLLVT